MRSARHLRIDRRLARVLEAHLAPEHELLGPINLALDSRCVLQPDLAIVQSGYDQLAYTPDQVSVVIEITSSEPDPNCVRDFAAYQRSGLPWYWIIDQDTLVLDVYELQEGGYQLVLTAKPGETVTLPAPAPASLDTGTLA